MPNDLHSQIINQLTFWTFCLILFVRYNYQKLYDCQIHYLLYLLIFHTCMNNFVLLFTFLIGVFILVFVFRGLIIVWFCYFLELFSKEKVIPISQKFFTHQEINLSYQILIYDGCDPHFLGIFSLIVIQYHHHNNEDNLRLLLIRLFKIHGLGG